jgi:LPXTG-motif cell wall-anchored protein
VTTHKALISRMFIAAGAATLLLAPITAATAQHPAASASHTLWTGGAPLPPAHGVGLSRNQDGEPGMGVTPTGQFWIASDIAPYAASDPRVSGGLLSGADIWTSTDHGRSYRWVADPFGTTDGAAGLAGEDTDLAVAPAKNSKGFYNVYATSLWIGSSSLAWSQDGGKTWSVNPLGGLPTQDRPWLVADGPCTVYVAYHQLPTFTPWVNAYNVCSNGNVPISNGVAIDPVNETTLSASDFPGLSNSFNKLGIDTSKSSKYRHNIYVPMSLCQVAQFPDLVSNASASNCPKGTQYLVAVSSDRGNTFTYHKVALDPSGATLVWAATVASDAAGTVYFVWSDSSNSYLNVSHDGGLTWTKSRRLNPKGTAAVYPTVAGGRAGRVDVAWYGTDRAGNSNDPKKMGKPNASGSAKWVVELARSTDGGDTFHLRTVTGTIHRGELCTHGSGCGDTNSRNLLDDFGLAIDPTTGLDSITYTSDRPAGTGAHAFTGFTTERMRASAQPAQRATGDDNSPAATKRKSAASSLPQTGSGPLLGVVGLLLVAGGLVLRRRTA